MLFAPDAFEPLTDERWDPERVRAAVREIVADVDSAYEGPQALWPADEWDGWALLCGRLALGLCLRRFSSGTLDHDHRHARGGAQAEQRADELRTVSGRIISSAPRPVQLAIGVSTKPGQSAVTRTPASASSRSSERVRAISAALAAP